MNQYAKNVMRPLDVATSAQVAPDTSLQEVYALLIEHEYIAVIEDTRRIGVISRTDVLRELSKEAM